MGTNGLNYTGSGGGGSPGLETQEEVVMVVPSTVIVRYPAEDYNIEILVVAGGGGGGSNSDINGSAGGGGGAGGVIYYDTYAVKGGKNYIVEVGRGGAGGGGSARNIPDSRGKNGQRSTFGDLLALGGGGGGGGYDGTVGDGRNDGMVGGSGGGGGSNGNSPANGYCLAGKGTIDQGNDGGNGSDASGSDGAGGGGGAGGVGGDGVGATATAQGGAGGIGNAYSITGTSTYYAGGGGGGGHTNDSDSGGGAGGNGGGAAGGNVQQDGNNATANTGGGGGGAGCRQTNNNDGGNGGSGIIIVAYKAHKEVKVEQLAHHQDLDILFTHLEQLVIHISTFISHNNHNSDKDILITPNRGQSNDPKIEFSGATAGSASTITMIASSKALVMEHSIFNLLMMFQLLLSLNQIQDH